MVRDSGLNESIRECCKLLADVQVNVVDKAGEHYLVVAGNVETKFPQAQISAGLRPAIQDRPTLTLPNLMDDLRRADADVEHAKTLLVAFVGNYDLVRFPPIANDCAVEVIVIHLEENVVLGIDVVMHPLQQMTLGKHRGKNKSARGRNNSV